MIAEAQHPGIQAGPPGWQPGEDPRAGECRAAERARGARVGAHHAPARNLAASNRERAPAIKRFVSPSYDNRKQEVCLPRLWRSRIIGACQSGFSTASLPGGSSAMLRHSSFIPKLPECRMNTLRHGIMFCERGLVETWISVFRFTSARHNATPGIHKLSHLLHKAALIASNCCKYPCLQSTVSDR